MAGVSSKEQGSAPNLSIDNVAQSDLDGEAEGEEDIMNVDMVWPQSEAETDHNLSSNPMQALDIEDKVQENEVDEVPEDEVDEAPEDEVDEAPEDEAPEDEAPEDEAPEDEEDDDEHFANILSSSALKPIPSPTRESRNLAVRALQRVGAFVLPALLSPAKANSADMDTVSSKSISAKSVVLKGKLKRPTESYLTRITSQPNRASPIPIEQLSSKGRSDPYDDSEDEAVFQPFGILPKEQCANLPEVGIVDAHEAEGEMIPPPTTTRSKGKAGSLAGKIDRPASSPGNARMSKQTILKDSPGFRDTDSTMETRQTRSKTRNNSLPTRLNDKAQDAKSGSSKTAQSTGNLRKKSLKRKAEESVATADVQHPRRKRPDIPIVPADITNNEPNSSEEALSDNDSDSEDNADKVADEGIVESHEADDLANGRVVISETASQSVGNGSSTVIQLVRPSKPVSGTSASTTSKASLEQPDVRAAQDTTIRGLPITHPKNMEGPHVVDTTRIATTLQTDRSSKDADDDFEAISSDDDEFARRSTSVVGDFSDLERGIDINNEDDNVQAESPSTAADAVNPLYQSIEQMAKLVREVGKNNNCNVVNNRAATHCKTRLGRALSNSLEVLCAVNIQLVRQIEGSFPELVSKAYSRWTGNLIADVDIEATELEIHDSLESELDRLETVAKQLSLAIEAKTRKGASAHHFLQDTYLHIFPQMILLLAFVFLSHSDADVRKAPSLKGLKLLRTILEQFVRLNGTAVRTPKDQEVHLAHNLIHQLQKPLRRVAPEARLLLNRVAKEYTIQFDAEHRAAFEAQMPALLKERRRSEREAGFLIEQNVKRAIIERNRKTALVYEKIKAELQAENERKRAALRAVNTNGWDSRRLSAPSSMSQTSSSVHHPFPLADDEEPIQMTDNESDEEFDDDPFADDPFTDDAFTDDPATNDPFRGSLGKLGGSGNMNQAAKHDMWSDMDWEILITGLEEYQDKGPKKYEEISKAIGRSQDEVVKAALEFKENMRRQLRVEVDKARITGRRAPVLAGWVACIGQEEEEDDAERG